MEEKKRDLRDRKRINSDFAVKYIKLLRSGEAQPCPECRTGFVSTEYDPKISHSFHCNKCNFMINID